LIWAQLAKEYTTNYPLKLDTEPIIKNADQVFRIVTEICKKFTVLVEDNGLCEFFYNDSGELRHERFAHLLFYGIADIYCEANNLDLSRESNAGRGSVDFKISKGYNAKVTVEVKYSSNPRLCHGYITQLPIYSKSERSTYSIYLIIQTKESTKAIESVFRLHNEESFKGNRVPEIMLVNGQKRPSASKA